LKINNLEEEDKQPRVDWKAFDSNSVDHENAYSSDGFIWELDTSGSHEGTGSVQLIESESNGNVEINSATSSRAMLCSLGVFAMAIVASL